MPDNGDAAAQPSKEQLAALITDTLKRKHVRAVMMHPTLALTGEWCAFCGGKEFTLIAASYAAVVLYACANCGMALTFVLPLLMGDNPRLLKG